VSHDEDKHGGLLCRLQNSFFLIGILSIAWLIVRTGRKPSRASYPCQQAAAFNANLWIATYIVPFFSGLQVDKTGFFKRKQTLAAVIVVLVATTGADGGVETLLRLMGSQDLKFYQSVGTGQTKGPEGLIGKNDVVIIKVNCQWDERGGGPRLPWQGRQLHLSQQQRRGHVPVDSGCC